MFLPLNARRSGDRVQLVATLGPASQTLAGALARAGATAFRLNASHLAPGELTAALEGVRRALPSASLVVDLQGAKMRLGAFPPRPVSRGERLVLALHPRDQDIPLPHPELFAAAAEGLTLSGDDGRLRVRVLRADAGRLEGECLADAVLRPRQGINLLEHPVRLSALTAADRARIAASGESVAFAFSFMEDGREADWLRREAPGCVVVGKVERREAVEQIDSLAQRVDALWICRGDLGEQLGAAGLARFVAALDPLRFACPVLMAGQVLQSLCEHTAATRTEICHLHDLLARGYAGIVLSDETAVGRDPVRAVEAAAELISTLVG